MLHLFPKEIQRAIRNFRFEKCETGIYFPDQKVIFDGWLVDINGEVSHNLIPVEGDNYILDIITNKVAIPPALYIAPYSGAVDPATTWTAANFTANSTEFTGYNEAVRPTYTTAVASSSSTNNTASPGVITFTGTGTINGAGILTVSTKNSTSGKLLSVARRASALTLGAGDVVNLKHTISFTDA